MTISRWQIQQHDFPAGEYARQHRVTIAIPLAGDIRFRTVVYCTDGQVIETLAAALQPALPDRELPVLIGVHSEPAVRAQEYLPGPNGQFLTHERFFVEDVRLWAHGTFGASMEREKSVVFGFSNGGAFAIAVAFRHSDRFAAAIAFSVPPFGNIPVFSPPGCRKPAVYLAAGNQGPEKSIRKNMLRLMKSLQREEVSVEFAERTAGHTLEFWASEFVAAAQWFHQAGT